MVSYLDHGLLLHHESLAIPLQNTGNFLELLKFLSQYDSRIEERLGRWCSLEVKALDFKSLKRNFCGFEYTNIRNNELQTVGQLSCPSFRIDK